MGEAINLVENFKVEKVIFNCGKYNDLENNLIKVLDKKKIPYYSCIKELNIAKYKLEFLNTKVYDNENDNSNVIYLNYKNYKFLFMGDSGTEREKDVLKKYNLKDIDFLKVGHHGSNTSSSKEFMESINPKYSLISVGKNNRYGHPKDEVLDILKNSRIYRTDLDGSIEIKLNRKGYKIRTSSPKEEGKMNYYNDIKNDLINNEINRKVKNYSINKSDLNTYYNVGKMLSEAGKHYGEGIIKEYSKRLTEELGKGYTVSNLKRFRQFYILIKKGATLSHQLTWSHYSELLPLNDIKIINYYILIIIESNLSIRQLRQRIKSHEYQRLDNNTKKRLIKNDEAGVVDFVKSPILIKNSSNYEEVSEKILQKLILEDIESFMKELGNSFCFIGSEYKIKLGDRYNYIDLLLFNIEFNCYVVVELKVIELKKEHIGQIEFYLNYIDNNLRKINQDKTVGIIICKKDNKYVIEYCSDNRIIAREYELV